MSNAFILFAVIVVIGCARAINQVAAKVARLEKRIRDLETSRKV